MPLTSNPDAFSLSAEDFWERFGFEKPQRGHGARALGDDDGQIAKGGGEGEGEEDGGGGVEEVIFYCKAGVRSRAAARLARGWEGVRVGDFRGGWVEWERCGGPSERG